MSAPPPPAPHLRRRTVRFSSHAAPLPRAHLILPLTPPRLLALIDQHIHWPSPAVRNYFKFQRLDGLAFLSREGRRRLGRIIGMPKDTADTLQKLAKDCVRQLWDENMVALRTGMAVPGVVWAQAVLGGRIKMEGR